MIGVPGARGGSGGTRQSWSPSPPPTSALPPPLGRRWALSLTLAPLWMASLWPLPCMDHWSVHARDLWGRPVGCITSLWFLQGSAMGMASRSLPRCFWNILRLLCEPPACARWLGCPTSMGNLSPSCPSQQHTLRT